jgi:hypothetical protein
MSFSTLPDALILTIASFLQATELYRLEKIDKRTHRLETDELWQKLCEWRWAPWPRYKLTPARMDWINENLSDMKWKGRYVWGEEDARRARITWEELESLKWFFNFTPHAGGRGQETLQKCQFQQGFMFLSQYLPMPYRLEVVDGVQYLRIYHFPPHRIDRLRCCAEWIMTNENVTLVSCDDDETLTYRDRGFQGVIEDNSDTT